jgi:hypothetical protein
MSITDVPTDFGAASFMKNFLPGFLFSVLLSYTFFPAFYPISNIFLNMDFVSRIAFWTISGVVLGIIISSNDFYIYKILSGYKGLPSYLCSILNAQELNEYNKNKNLLKYLQKEPRPSTNCMSCIEDKIIELSGEIRKYPFNKDPSINFFYPVTWTKLGNIIAEYETYPEVCYGMSFNVFWYRLWYVLSKDEQEDIGQRGAKSDFLSYMAFLFFLYSFFAGFGIYPQIKEFLSFGASDEIARWFIVWFLSFVVFFVIHRIFYDSAIEAHENYGGYIKALFDIHYDDILNILRPANSLDEDKCKIYSGYFEDYLQFN